MQVEFTDALRPMLNRYGTHPNFQLVIFTVDETMFSREIAPLAGFYPSVYAGAPWWFLDAPEAIRRYRAAVTESAGFAKTSGFIDDTRAFCSIPARHDMSRRLDAGFVARLVAEHRLDEDEAYRRHARPGRHQSEKGVQAVTCGTSRAPRLSRSLPGTPDRRPGSDRAPRGRQLPPGPSGLVHRPRPDADEWGIAAFTGRRPDAADALAPRTACTP